MAFVLFKDSFFSDSEKCRVKEEWDVKIKRVKKNIEFFENYLEINMTKSGIRELGNDYVQLSYRKLTDIVECVAAPDDWSVITKSSKPDKKMIKVALKKGVTLDFATLVTGREKLVIK